MNETNTSADSPDFCLSTKSGKDGTVYATLPIDEGDPIFAALSDLIYKGEHCDQAMTELLHQVETLARDAQVAADLLNTKSDSLLLPPQALMLLAGGHVGLVLDRLACLVRLLRICQGEAARIASMNSHSAPTAALLN
ncbi:MAG: hypothetical protein LBE59_02135 [Nevskiaceae bacterium]|jgi:hypothetical protein|nr:hypothetical protein [Nevskiaceae bacterium]